MAMRPHEPTTYYTSACGTVGYRSPHAVGGTTVSIMLYIDDVDVVYARAIDAGAKVLRPVQNQFYGDRSGTLEDPFGHMWALATHIEDLSHEEIMLRAQTTMKPAGEQRSSSQ